MSNRRLNVGKRRKDRGMSSVRHGALGRNAQSRRPFGGQRKPTSAAISGRKSHVEILGQSECPCATTQIGSKNPVEITFPRKRARARFEKSRRNTRPIGTSVRDDVNRIKKPSQNYLPAKTRPCALRKIAQKYPANDVARTGTLRFGPSLASYLRASVVRRIVTHSECQRR